MKETATKVAADQATTNVGNNQQNSLKRTTYTYDDVIKSATKYFDGDELAASVWLNKYALKDSAGNL